MRPPCGQYYRWRWENEGQFRPYKLTLDKTKLVSRTVRLVHREAEGSLLAMQLMLAHGALAMPRRTTTGEPRVCSPRKVLLTIREEIKEKMLKRHRCYWQRLRQAERERRRRTSAKATRVWPRRKPHRTPKPPKIRRLSARQKARIIQLQRQII